MVVSGIGYYLVQRQDQGGSFAKRYCRSGDPFDSHHHEPRARPRLILSLSSPYKTTDYLRPLPSI